MVNRPALGHQQQHQNVRYLRKSVRNIADSTDIRKIICSRNYKEGKKKLKHYPYKMHIAQKLNECEYVLREAIYVFRTMLERLRTSRALGNTLFNNEAYFRFWGYIIHKTCAIEVQTNEGNGIRRVCTILKRWYGERF